MKVAYADTHVLGSKGLVDERSFAIRTNAHAFRMLSSGMYSDKIAAVIREIGCNAHDAHIAMGTPQRPIEVKLPNSIDNQFYIKDYGIGLDHEDVMGLYTTYFASTKQQSNDMTGAFGLGSKSPFSYVDSFTVTACKDNKRRIYSAHIGKEGVPTIAMMHEADIPKDDTWKTGIMVGFPVKREDISTFQDRAQKIYKFFAVMPDIIGGDKIHPLEISKDYKTFAFVKNLPSAIVAVMGGVMYPISTNKLNLPYDHAMQDSLTSISEIMLRVPIGAIQIAASREELQYDDTSRAYIIDSIKEVITEVVKDFVVRAKQCKTWEDKCEFHGTKKNTAGIRLDADLLKFCGVPDKDAKLTAGMYGQGLCPLPKVTAAEVYQGVIFESPRSEPSNPSIGFKISVKRTDHRHYGLGNVVSFDPDICIVSGPEDRPTTRIREAMSRGDITERTVIFIAGREKHSKLSSITAALNSMKHVMPGVAVYDLANFPAPPLKKSFKPKKGKALKLPDAELLVFGVPTKLSAMKDEDKVFIRLTAHAGWGEHRWLRHPIVNDANTFIENYNWWDIVRSVERVEEKLKPGLKPIINLRMADISRLNIKLRPEWQHATTHIKGILESAAFQATLTDFLGSYTYTIDLDSISGDSTDFIDNMATIKSRGLAEWASIEAVLKKHDLDAVVNKVYTDSTAADIPDSSEITDIVSRLGVLTKFSGAALSIPTIGLGRSKTYKKEQKGRDAFTLYTLEDLRKKYPQTFPLIIDEVLSEA